MGMKGRRVKFMYPSLGFGSTIPAKPNDDKRTAKLHMEVTRNLTDALFAYLTFDDQYVLDEVVSEPVSYGPTPEALISAVKGRDVIQHQIEQIEASLEGVPEMQVKIIEATMLTPLRASLDYQNDYVSQVQQALEKGQEQKQAG